MENHRQPRLPVVVREARRQRHQILTLKTIDVAYALAFSVPERRGSFTQNCPNGVLVCESDWLVYLSHGFVHLAARSAECSLWVTYCIDGINSIEPPQKWLGASETNRCTRLYRSICFSLRYSLE